MSILIIQKSFFFSCIVFHYYRKWGYIKQNESSTLFLYKIICKQHQGTKNKASNTLESGIILFEVTKAPSCRSSVFIVNIFWISCYLLGQFILNNLTGWISLEVNLFQPSVYIYIETSHLLCRIKQMTGFYMKRNTGLKWSM